VLIQSQKKFVFGTEILLLGCKHNPKTFNYDPRQSEMYEKLREFKPEKILLELTNDYCLSNLQMYSDAQSLKAYIDDTGTPHSHYDIKPDIGPSVTEASLDAESETLEQSVDVRDQLKREYPRLFSEFAEVREENGVSEISNSLRRNSRVAFHCGMNHMVSYANYLDFISELS